VERVGERSRSPPATVYRALLSCFSPLRVYSDLGNPLAIGVGVILLPTPPAPTRCWPSSAGRCSGRARPRRARADGRVGPRSRPDRPPPGAHPRGRRWRVALALEAVTAYSGSRFRRGTPRSPRARTRPRSQDHSPAPLPNARATRRTHHKIKHPHGNDLEACRRRAASSRQAVFYRGDRDR